MKKAVKGKVRSMRENVWTPLNKKLVLMLAIIAISGFVIFALNYRGMTGYATLSSDKITLQKLAAAKVPKQTIDTDGDGVLNTLASKSLRVGGAGGYISTMSVPKDNCPTVSNYDQKDTDNDGIGNACDNNDDRVYSDWVDADRDGYDDNKLVKSRVAGIDIPLDPRGGRVWDPPRWLSSTAKKNMAKYWATYAKNPPK